MDKIQFPCRECQERHEGCHGQCRRYLIAQAYYRQKHKDEQEQKELEMITISNRVKRRMPEP